MAGAERLRLPDPGRSEPAPQASAPCENRPGQSDNCVRVLACLGVHGVYFDGRAYGWDTGPVLGQTSTGVDCAGHWASGGLMGTGQAGLYCQDGLTARVIYYSQDPVTGTVIGSGTDSAGRGIRVWSGDNVIKYLTPDGRPSAELPCGAAPIPIS